MRFTIEEINLICIYDTGTRTGLIGALTDMIGYLQEDEDGLRALAEAVISQMRAMTDEEYAQIQQEFIPDYEVTEE